MTHFKRKKGHKKAVPMRDSGAGMGTNTGDWGEGSKSVFGNEKGWGKGKRVFNGNHKGNHKKKAKKTSGRLFD